MTSRQQIVEAALKEDPKFWGVLLNSPKWLSMDVCSSLGNITLRRDEIDDVLIVLRVKGIQPPGKL